MSKNLYNFKWIGTISSEDSFTKEEQVSIEDQLNAKGCYPLFMTIEEMKPYLKFYENVLKPLFHNFKSLYYIN
jgi:trehalose-6-phosphate synthase